ncbi:hypothetical protein Acsp03_22160 [Actinomadura sp. NBRC 104412]|nr:hypothetical protein Acsp03_22160 [Actinomadura sp. NBRC 104412]
MRWCGFQWKAPALEAITGHLVTAEVVHFDDRFRTSGRLAWASAGKYMVVAVHARRGRDAVKAAGVLPPVRVTPDARARRGQRDRQGPERGVARQAIDSLFGLDQVAENARRAGKAEPRSWLRITTGTPSRDRDRPELARIGESALRRGPEDE